MAWPGVILTRRSSMADAIDDTGRTTVAAATPAAARTNLRREME
jgi:hypothetical protein